MNTTTTISLDMPNRNRFISDRYTALRIDRGIEPMNDRKAIRKARQDKRRAARERDRMKQEAAAHARSRALIAASKSNGHGVKATYCDFTGYGPEARDCGWGTFV